MFNDRILLFLTITLTAGFVFAASADTGYAGVVMVEQGCCTCPLELGCSTTSQNNCPSGCIFTQGEVCSDEGVCVIQSEQPEVSAVPVLSEWGLIAMTGILGVIGFLVIRRRKAIM
jgi:hypothetical protein